MTAAKPIVWAFCNGLFGGDDQVWVAVADDGRFVTQHVSSGRSWGQHDVGPTGMHHGDYVRVLGTDDVDYRVLPDGDGPPDYVWEAHQRLRDAKAQADAEVSS